MKTSRNNLRLHRKRRVRAKVSGTSDCPRLSVFKSLKNVYVQVIDDTKGATLVSADMHEMKKNDMAAVTELGKVVARKCLDKKISQVVFDRSGYKYHGKVKALADSAREGGLKF